MVGINLIFMGLVLSCVIGLVALQILLSNIMVEFMPTYYSSHFIKMTKKNSLPTAQATRLLLLLKYF